MNAKNKMSAVLILSTMAIATLLTIAPVAADPVKTEVTISSGGGSPPVVKCKWEQDLTIYLEDGDPMHATPGSQFLPPCVYQGKKTVQYWAVVTDEEDMGHVARVDAYVYHPDESFKYQVPMYWENKENIPSPIDAFVAAANAGLVHYNTGENYDTVYEQLIECLAEVWMGEADLDYCQMAGDYRVEVIATDTNNNNSAPLINTFLYVRCACCEIDFTNVDYGSVNICSETWRGGDNVFGTNDKPTIRNIGNVGCNISIYQDNMGFGKDVYGNWDVRFDARLGVSGTNVYYDPFENKMLPEKLPLCHTEKLDFSIHVKKGISGATYHGKMWISCSDAGGPPGDP